MAFLGGGVEGGDTQCMCVEFRYQFFFSTWVEKYLYRAAIEQKNYQVGMCKPALLLSSFSQAGSILIAFSFKTKIQFIASKQAKVVYLCVCFFGGCHILVSCHWVGTNGRCCAVWSMLWTMRCAGCRFHEADELSSTE